MYKMNKLNGLCYVLIKTYSMASWLYILRQNRFKAQGGGVQNIRFNSTSGNWRHTTTRLTFIPLPCFTIDFI